MGDRLTICFADPPEKGAKIQIYSVSGRLLKTIRVSSRKTYWDGRDQRGMKLPAGVYVIYAEIEGHAYSRAFQLVR